MKVCDVVLNSIWYDPRVRKQIAEYNVQGVEVVAVGMKCRRYDSDRVSQIPCKTYIAEIDGKYDGKQRGIVNKLKREKLRHAAVRDTIIYEKPDVIHANDLNALIPAYAAKKKLGCKLVYDSHEINVENYTGKRSYLAKLMRLVEKHIVKRVDLMVCVSNAAAEYFEREYKIKKPMVITNCSLKKECVALDGIEKNQGFEILNHGQFYSGRGYDIMVRACPLLKDYPEIHPVARGFGVMEEELHKMVDETNANDRFIFYPPVRVEELIPMATHSHVGVAITEPICLNFELSVSNKLFEYASAGLPVIMSDIPEHRYLNEKYEFGIIIPENTPKAFAEAAIKMYTDKDFYQKCAENARKMSDEINWENEFGKLIGWELSAVQ